jgi:RNA polymerase sigma factor (sigma-70 family)
MSQAFSADDLCGHAEFLQRMAGALLGDAEAARDATQDTFVAALEHPPQEPGGLRPWLATVLRNRARSARIAADNRARRESDVARAELVEGGQEIVERIELQRLVCEAILALDEPKRSVVFLRYYENLAPGEIAERRGEPLKTVKSRLNRALEELRERLDRSTHGHREAWALALLPLVSRPSAPAAPSAFAQVARLAVAGVVVVLGAFAWRLATRAAESEPALEPTRVASAPTAPPASAPAVAAPAPSSTREPLSAPTQGSLEVHLRWESDGQPAASVGLEALARNDPSPRETRTRAATDGSGVARFDGLVPGPVELRLDRTTTFEAVVAAGETRTLELVVPTGGDVVGRVVDSAGAPVAGATLWAESLLARLPDAWPMGTSAADGTFRLRSLQPIQRILARSPAHLTTSVVNLYELKPDAHGVRNAELALEAGGHAFAGRVLDPEGEPVPGAVLWIGANTHGTSQFGNGPVRTGTGSASARTDAEGAFVSPSRLDAGVHELTVVAAGFPAWRGDVEIDEADASLEIRLAPPATIQGSVTDAEGAFVPGARVTAVSAGGDRIEMGGVIFIPEAHTLPALRTTTDASGEFVLDWAAAGPYTLEAEVPGRPELGRAKGAYARGQTEPVLLALDPEPRIAGRVVDSAGRGLADWRVTAELEGGMTLRETCTDAAGHFVLYSLEPGERQVTATAPGKGPQPSVNGTAAAGTLDLELVVAGETAPSARLSGQVLDSAGRVPADVRVLAQAMRTGLAVVLSIDAGTGRFEYGPLEAGSYRLKVMRDQLVLALGEPFELAPAGPTDAGLLQIPEPGELAVSVPGLDPEMTSLRLVRSGFGSVRLDLVDGAFQATGIPPGTWWLKPFDAERFAPDREVVIRSGERAELALELVPGAALSLRLDMPDADSPQSDLVVEIRDAAGALLCHELRAAGTHAVGNAWGFRLPFGAITIEARTEDGRRGSATAVVTDAPGEPVVLVVR